MCFTESPKYVLVPSEKIDIPEEFKAPLNKESQWKLWWLKGDINTDYPPATINWEYSSGDIGWEYWKWEINKWYTGAKIDWDYWKGDISTDSIASWEPDTGLTSGVINWTYTKGDIDTDYTSGTIN